MSILKRLLAELRSGAAGGAMVSIVNETGPAQPLAPLEFAA